MIHSQSWLVWFKSPFLKLFLIPMENMNVNNFWKQGCW